MAAVASTSVFNCLLVRKRPFVSGLAAGTGLFKRQRTSVRVAREDAPFFIDEVRFQREVGPFMGPVPMEGAVMTGPLIPNNEQ